MEEPIPWIWNYDGNEIELEGSGDASSDVEPKPNRCWEFRSTSKAFCKAMDKKPNKNKSVGFFPVNRR